MIIKKLSYKPTNSTVAPREIVFDDGCNYFYSKNNGTGKTTLMRFLLYSLGFNVPSTKKVNFKKYETTLDVLVDGQLYQVTRKNGLIEIAGESLDLSTIISLLFHVDNKDIADNLLGTIYFDQDKGWTLLNRGIVIGEYRFIIETFLYGLSYNDKIQKLRIQQEEKDSLLKRYKKIGAIASYKQDLVENSGEVEQEEGDISYSTKQDVLEKDRRILLLRKRECEKEIKCIEDITSENSSFINSIERYKLSVKDQYGNIIKVNRSTIVLFDDNEILNQIALAQKKNELEKIKIGIDLIDSELSECDEYNNQLFRSETALKAINKRIVSIPIDLDRTNKIIAQITEEKKKLEAELINLIKKESDWLNELNEQIEKYIGPLSLDDFYDKEKGCLTPEIKSLSGAIYHKMVFAYRISYNIILSKKLGVRLPLLVDSPAGREVEKSTVDQLIDILMNEFSEHQIFIASINKFRNNVGKTIICDGKMFDFGSEQMEFDF